MASHAYRLQTILLVCLTATWPLAASAQASARPAAVERLAVSQTAPEDANDPIWLWFRKQDKLLDEIFMRLARIENLVSDIHRLIERMPDQAGATVAPALATPTARTTHPVKPPPAAEPEDDHDQTTSFIADWAPQLAGGGLLALLLLWRARRRSTRPTIKMVAPPTIKASPPTPPKKTGAPVPAKRNPAPTIKTAVSTPAPTVVTAASHAKVALNDEEPSEQAGQTLELAEIMLSMGLGHGAAQTLIEQIRHEPKQALRHWLKLLEIYRKNGQQSEFEDSAEELRKYFNVKSEDWHTRPATPHSLEDYPHIAERLTELWGSSACQAYLHNLLADNRGGSRAGFPQPVAEELLLLVAMLRDDGVTAA